MKKSPIVVAWMIRMRFLSAISCFGITEQPKHRLDYDLATIKPYSITYRLEHANSDFFSKSKKERQQKRRSRRGKSQDTEITVNEKKTAENTRFCTHNHSKKAPNSYDFFRFTLFCAKNSRCFVSITVTFLAASYDR